MSRLPPSMLTRLLSAKDDRFSSSDAAVRALLSYRLGHARAQRGDHSPGRARARERAIELAPDSEGATLSRRELVDIVKARRRSISQGDRRHPPRRDHRPHRRARRCPRRMGRRAPPARTSSTPRAAAAEVAIASGHTADNVHQSAFLQVNKPYVMRDDEPYKAAIDADTRPLITGREDAPLGARSRIDARPKPRSSMWPDLEEAFGRFGVPGARRVPSSSHAAAVSMFCAAHHRARRLPARSCSTSTTRHPPTSSSSRRGRR